MNIVNEREVFTMRNLEQYGRECIKNLNAISIYPNEIDNFIVNTRAKRRWGQAQKKNGRYSININALLLNENCPEKGLYETLYHELLHCVDGCMNHGDKWQELAELVSDCYNVDITRCSSDEKKLGIELAEEKRQEKNIYKVKCCNCGTVTKRMGYRAPKWYIHPEWYACKKCVGKLEKVVDND